MSKIKTSDNETYSEKLIKHKDFISFMEKMYGINIEEFETTMTPLHYFEAYQQYSIDQVKNHLGQLTEKKLRKMAKKVCNGHQHAMRYGNMLSACFRMGKMVIENIDNLNEKKL